MIMKKTNNIKSEVNKNVPVEKTVKQQADRQTNK